MTKSTLILLLAFVSNIVFAQYNIEDLSVVSQDVGKPLTYKYLQLFPIYANGSYQEANQHIGNYISLQSALKEGQVSISEMEAPESQSTFDPFSNSLIVSQELTSYEEDMSAINPTKSHLVESTGIEEDAGGMMSIFDNNILHPDARASAQTLTAQVFINNLSEDTLFVMAGEVLKGGRQDRVIAQDMIVPPNSGKVHLPVFCAEKDRWYYRSKSSKDFDQYFAVSSLKVRKAVMDMNNQAAVWNAIEDVQQTNNINSKTKAYADLIASTSFNNELEGYIRFFANKLEKEIVVSDDNAESETDKVVGVIVATGGNIIGCDIFATHDLFTQQYEGLLHSYATDAITFGQKNKMNLDREVKLQDGSISMNQASEYLQKTLKMSDKKDSKVSVQDGEVSTLEEENSLISLTSEQKIHISSFE